MSNLRTRLVTLLVVALALAPVLPASAHFASAGVKLTLVKSVPIAGVQLASTSGGTLFALTNKGIVAELSPSGQLLHTFALRASAIAITPDGATLYAVQKKGKDVAIVNTSTGATENTIVSSAMTDPTSIALSPHGNTLYVLNRGTNTYNPDSVIAFSTQTGNRTWTDKIGVVGSAGAGLSVSADGQTVYVPSGGSMFGGNSGASPYGGFSAVNTALSSHSDVRLRGSYDVNSVTTTPGGNTAWVAAEGMPGMYRPAVYVYDLQSGKVMRTLRAPGSAPVSVALSPANAFVAFNNNLDYAQTYDSGGKAINYVGIYGIAGGGMVGKIVHAFPPIKGLLVSANGTGENLDVLTVRGLYLYSIPAPVAATTTGTTSSGSTAS